MQRLRGWVAPQLDPLYDYCGSVWRSALVAILAVAKESATRCNSPLPLSNGPDSIRFLIAVSTTKIPRVVGLK